MMKTWTFIDKSDWGHEGEWLEEPDKCQWIDEDTKYPCLIVRNPNGGNLCGYAGVTEDHPWFGINYQDPAPGYEHHIDCIISVHGEVNYSSFCQDNDKEHGVCHIPEPGATDRVWWFGFDCAHCQDISPQYQYRFGNWSKIEESRTYKNIEYVRKETESLAAQLYLVAHFNAEESL